MNEGACYSIQEHISTLLGPEEVPALAHLINKPLTARELMQVSVDYLNTSFTRKVYKCSISVW